MKTLQVYPTSRAIRSAQLQWKQSDALIPAMMRIDEFEQRAVTLGDRALIDPLQRVLLMREAADFEAFKVFKVDRVLVKFLSSSEGLFRFFEELALEGVDFASLAEADAYVEFGEHLSILEMLKNRYRTLLETRGETDRMFIPDIARLHEGFIGQYDRIEIFLEGLLSRYELELFSQISQQCSVILHYITSPFSAKMETRLAGLGISLTGRSRNVIDLSSQSVLEALPVEGMNESVVIAVTERVEQVSAALMAVDEMVSSGIAPERIALILPDEGFKEAFRLYDSLNNLNFAMGFDYANGRNYKILHALLQHWRHPDEQTQERLERYGLSKELLARLSLTQKRRVHRFFESLEPLELTESDPLRIARLAEAREEFARLFSDESLRMSEWLSLWLQVLGSIRIDDLRGGMITVMGVLETRGVSYEGVVIVDFNDGIVPASPAKDQFLNSQVRAFADLPTRSDREALQKHYYHRLLSQAQASTIIYATGDNRLPSKFLYELGLENIQPQPVPYGLLYEQPSRIIAPSDPVVEDFDARAQTWSASRLKTWLGCKRQYYYRYLRGIKAKEDESFNEGRFLHTLLDYLYREADQYDDPQKLRERLHRLMDELLPEEKAANIYRKMLWKQKLESFIAQQIKHFRAGWRVVEREKIFKSVIEGLSFEGRIDRIDQDSTHTLVIDYKSGKITEANRSKNLEKATDFQMNIYRRLLAPQYHNISLAFQTIFDGATLVEAAALDEKDTFLTEHLNVLRQTRSFVAEKTETLSRCSYCEFALLCGRGEYA